MLFPEVNSNIGPFSIAETDADSILDLNKLADNGSFTSQLNSSYHPLNEFNKYLSSA